MPPSDPQQARELARVSGRLERAVAEYVERVPVGGEFTGHDLDHYVCGRACATPGSATRILRLLRKRGALNYRVSKRSEARYQRLAVEEPGQTAWGF